MIHYLAQLKLPGANDSQVTVNYPKGFVFQDLGSVISKAVPIIIGLAGLGLLLMLISAGYTFMTSAGDAKKMEQGKQRLTYAIVGFLIVFGAYWVVQIVGIMFGKGITPGFQ